MKAGRRDKYQTHIEPRLEEIGWWARDGLVEAEMCKRLGVSVSGFALHKNRHIELMTVLKENREVADYRVENGLYKRAIGFEYEEVTKEPALVTLIKLNRKNEKFDSDAFDKELKEHMVITKVVTKQVVPDTTAQIYWTKNRRPKQWRDKQEIGGQVTINYNVPDIEKEE